MREPVALFLTEQMSLLEAAAAAKYAETRGFDAVWQAESVFVRDPFLTMAYLAAQTSRIQLGCGVVHHALRNVGALCASLMTLEELAPKRVQCALSSWNDTQATKVGIERRKPMLAMRETVDGLRRLLAYERVTLLGDSVTIVDLQLEPLERRREPKTIPMMIGGSGAFVALAGEIGDGIVLNSMVSPSYTSHAVSETRVGLQKAHRDPQSFAVMQLIACAVQGENESPTAPVKRARQAVASAILQQPAWMRANGIPQGLIDELNQLARSSSHDDLLHVAADLVPESIARLVVACGTPSQVRAKVREYIQAGATIPVMVALDDGVRAMIDALARGYTEPSQSWLVESL